MPYTMYSQDGRALTFDLDERQRIANISIDWRDDETELRFSGALPDHEEPDDLPEEITAVAAARGRRVCGYRSHCEVCYCNDDGTVTCERMC